MQHFGAFPSLSLLRKRGRGRCGAAVVTVTSIVWVAFAMNGSLFAERPHELIVERFH